MSADSARAGTLALVSPVIAIAGAAFLACCALAAVSSAAASDYDTAEILLLAALPAFGLAQAAALLTGISAIVRSILKKAAGLPEAALGVTAACLFIITALYLLNYASGPAAA